MAEQKTPTESQSLPSSSPPSTPQTDATGWAVMLKSIFFFIALPGAVVLLIKWLAGV